MSQSSAYEYALKLLTARSYTARSLLRKLTQKGIAAEDAAAVMARLESSGLIDDAKYARQYARSKVIGSGASTRRVTQDLRRKGIADGVAKAALEQVFEDEEVDVRKNAERVARKKLAQMGNLEPLVLRRRLFSFLARRGYELEDIKSVVASVMR